MIRKTLKITGRVAVALGVVGFIGLSLLAWRLSEGPIRADFLKPRIENALSDPGGGYRVRAAKTQIAWTGWKTGLHLQAEDVRMVRRNGTMLARLPLLGVKVSVRHLLAGQFRPTEIIIQRPELHMTRSVDGRVEFRLPKRTRPSATSAMPRLFDVLAQRRRTDGPLSALNLLRIEKATLVVTDAYLGRTWKTENFNAAMRRDDAGIKANLAFDLSIAGKTVKVTATGLHDRERSVISLALDFKNLGPDLFASARGHLRLLGWFHLPLSGRVTLRLLESGHITASEFELHGRDGKVVAPKYLPQPLPLKKLTMKGNLSVDGQILTLSSFKADFGGAAITIRGRASRLPGEPFFNGSAVLENIPTADIRRYWPQVLKSEARDWVAKNITEGTISRLALRLVFGQTVGADGNPELSAIDGTFSFDNLSIRFLRDFPAVTAASGTARFDDDGLHFAISHGQLAGVSVQEAIVRLDGFSTGHDYLSVDTLLDGALPDFLNLIDRPPLNFARRVGVNPLAVRGRVKAHFRLGFELVGDLGTDDIAVDTTASLKGVFWRKGIFGLDLSDADLTMTINRAGMRLWGKGRLAAERATLDWRESFGAVKAERRSFRLQTRFQPETLARIGLEARHFMSGSIGADLSLTGFDDGRNVIDGKYDFQQAAFTIPGLNVAKRAGVPGSGSAKIVLQGYRVSAVPAFQLDTPAIKARGAVTFHRDGETIRKLTVGSLVAGRTVLSGVIDGTAAGHKRITLNARSLDLQPILANRSEGGTLKLMPLTVSGSIGKLYFSPNRFMTGIAGDAVYDGNEWRRLVIKGNVPGGRPVSIRLVEQGKFRLLSVRTEDAGAALRAMNLADTIRGGRVSLTAQGRVGQVPAQYTGRLEGSNFRLRQAPVSGRVLKLSSFDKLAQRAASADGVAFKTIVIPFDYSRGKINVKNGRVLGTDIGVTLSGSMDYRRDVANMKGTIVPAYTLNSILGGVPVLGRLFVGEKNSGVFAARYSVAGQARDPKISVNMLSVLTPGFTRGLFDIFTGRADSGERREPMNGFGLPGDPNSGHSLGR